MCLPILSEDAACVLELNILNTFKQESKTCNNTTHVVNAA